MSMTNRGMNKLMEECGELVAVIAKKSAYPEGKHPSSKLTGGIDRHIEDEMGDVQAAIWFVQEKLGLSDHDIHVRAVQKFNLYKDWDKDPNLLWDKDR